MVLLTFLFSRTKNFNITLRSCLLSSILLILAACQTSVPALTDSNAGQTGISEPQIIEKPEVPVQISTEDNIPDGNPEFTNLGNRIEFGFGLQEYYDHPDVMQQLSNYTANQRYFDLITERASPFLYSMVEEIDRRNLPMELVLIPIVESTFNPNAYSREHAVGLWQFVGATARSFGIQQDWWYDGRRDPQASTVAALDYLEDLYKQFDQDWLLALAAYNTGEGNVRRAIRRAGVSKEEASFWDLRLPGETRNHIPRILAIAKIVSDSELNGISLTEIPNQLTVQNVEVNAQIDIARAAELADIDYQQLRNLNPGYLQWATHPDRPQRLLLPTENARKLTIGLQEIDTELLLSWDRYEIRSGDTLGGIARKLSTRVDILQTVNSLRGSQIIAGNSLLIPRSADSQLIAAQPALMSRARPAISVPASYTIRRGDNLWSIARKFDLRSAEIASRNTLSLDQLLRPGQILDLSYALADSTTEANDQVMQSPQYYRVRSGDSMAKIAERFAMGLDELLMLNSISSNDLIHPGQSIRVNTDQSSVN